MPLGIQVLVPDSFLHLEGASDQLMNALRANSPFIAALIEATIRGRTHVMTGALSEAITGKPYPGGVKGQKGVNLAKWYANDGPQLDQWNRVYVGYQEGPPLGVSTYTNGPRQMFERVETDDMDLIQLWADLTIGLAVNGLVNGSGGVTDLGA